MFLSGWSIHGPATLAALSDAGVVAVNPPAGRMVSPMKMRPFPKLDLSANNQVGRGSYEVFGFGSVDLSYG